MSLTACRWRPSTVTLVALILAVLVCVPAAGGAQVSSPASADRALELGADLPDWSADQVAVLRSFFERVDVEETLLDVRAPRLRREALDVAALSAGLDDSWEAPFRYVQRAVSYVPYFGSVRGARGTLMSGAGNALDQSLLLAALYRVRGITTRLVHGRLRWQHAVALVGPSQVDHPRRGDPWLRWVETAADHWWVEARRGAQWVELDPSFAGSVGDVFGPRAEVVDEPPPSMQARATVEVLQGTFALTAIALPLGELVATPVQLALADPVPEAEAVAADDNPVAQPSADADIAPSAMPDEPFDPLAEILPPREGPLTLELRVGDRAIPVGPLAAADLPGVSLRLRIQTPMGPATTMTLPWGDRTEARLVALVGVGRMGNEALVRPIFEIHGLLRRLAEAELAALRAYEMRPRDDEEAARGEFPEGTIRPAPPLPVPVEVTSDGLAADEQERPLHPVEEFHVAVVQSWLDFQRYAPTAIGMIVLDALDRLRQPAPLVRTGVRLVGLNLQEPTATAAGELTVWTHDPVGIGGIEPARRRGIQSAYGLLGSAVLGHVLNSVADRPPETAFDVTLRTVGSGQRLAWFQPGSAPPPGWPVAAQVAALGDLRTGHTLIGPIVPVRRQDATLLGWWSLLPDSGTTTGRVHAPVGVAQGRVPLVDARDFRDLESLLATVRDLHRASRWLLQAADSESGALAALVPRACAATSLVGELLLAGAPSDWQPPMFADFCAAGSGGGLLVSR